VKQWPLLRRNAAPGPSRSAPWLNADMGTFAPANFSQNPNPLLRADRKATGLTLLRSIKSERLMRGKRHRSMVALEGDAMGIGANKNARGFVPRALSLPSVFPAFGGHGSVANSLFQLQGTSV